MIKNIISSIIIFSLFFIVLGSNNDIFKTLESNNQNDTSLLKSLINNIDKFDNTLFDNNLDSLVLEILSFNILNEGIKRTKNNNDKEVKKLNFILKTKTINLQKKEFPILRKKFVKIFTKTIDMPNAKILISDKNLDTLVLITPNFLNKNKYQIEQLHKPALNFYLNLRFKKIIYKASENPIIPDFKYNINSPKDTDLGSKIY